MIKRATLPAAAAGIALTAATNVAPANATPSAMTRLAPHHASAARFSATPPLASDEVWRDFVHGFSESASVLRRIPVGQRLYETAPPTAIGGFGEVDGTGVRVVTYPNIVGPQQNTVAQAQYALANLNSYRLTKRVEYLDIAKKNAQRIIDRRVISGGAWYYPYEFDYAVVGDTTKTLKAPWYSGMAQGQALSLFTRLYETTADRKWKDAADKTFVSLLQSPQGSAPYGAYVDPQAHLWLEEYPHVPTADSENVLNGHLFAVMGVHDYWMMTGGNPLAAKIVRGGLKTIEDTLMSNFRRRNWASAYMLTRPNYIDLSYHTVHEEEFRQMWGITHDPFWLTADMTFRGDFPKRAVSGKAVLTRGITNAYQVDAWSRVAATQSVALTSDTEASFNARWRVKDGPIMLRISSGDLSGWWVTEDPLEAFALGATEPHNYAPQAKLTFTGAKVYTAFTLDSAGHRTAPKSVWIRNGSTAPTTASAWVAGRQAFYVAAGTFAGQWLEADDSLVLGSYD